MRAKSSLIVISIVILAVVSSVVLYAILEGWYHFWLISILTSIAIATMVCGVAGCFLIYALSVDTLRSPMRSDTAFMRIRNHLRGIGYRVDDQTEGKLVVQLDQNRTARIRFRPTDNGSEFRVYPGLTTGGLTLTFFLCIFLPFCGIGALIMAYGAIDRSTKFSSAVVRPISEFQKNQGDEKDLEVRADPRLVTINTLQIADRLASEALSAIESSYQDSSWLTVALGMLAYTVFFMAFGFNTPGLDGSLRAFVLFLTLVLLITVLGLMIWRFKKSFLTRSTSLRLRIMEIQAALNREQGITPSSEGDESGLEMIMKIWPELPVWTEYRRNFYQRNPAASLLIAGMILFAWQLGYYGTLGGSIALALISSSSLLYVWTKIGNSRSDQKMIKEWNSKIKDLDDQIGSKLGEL